MLGLVTSEFLYRRHPDEHEGQLTKTKSLLVSKAILSRRALRMGLGRFVLMSHSEVESGGRQRLSILADAFESVLGAIYLDQGFEAGRAFIQEHLLSESDAISSDKRHTNYKSHLQEYVQNSFRTHPVYRIRSEYGPDHSKHFMVEVMVGKRTLGEGRGHNKKEAEQAAARDALEKVEKVRRQVREDDDHEDVVAESTERDPDRGRDRDRGRESRSERASRGESAGRARAEAPGPVAARKPEPPAREDDDDDDADSPAGRRRRRSRRGGRSRHAGTHDSEAIRPTAAEPGEAVIEEDDDFTEPVRPEGRSRRRGSSPAPRPKPDADRFEPESARTVMPADAEDDDTSVADEVFHDSPAKESPGAGSRAPAVRAPYDDARAETDDDPDADRYGAPPAPVVPPRAAIPQAAPVSFGRGKRRGPAPATPSAAAANKPAPEEAIEAQRVDPFAAEEPDDGLLPVVEVPLAEPAAEAETEAERDARIEEMERALDNFGRRRSPDHGRRGRRR